MLRCTVYGVKTVGFLFVDANRVVTWYGKRQLALEKADFPCGNW
jgi:hypothetical protein